MDLCVRQSRLPPRLDRLLHRLLMAGLEAADPAEAVRRHVARTGSILRVAGRRYDLRRHGRVVVVGAGKATARMAVALEEILGRRIAEGLIVVKYGHRLPTSRVAVVEAAHPVPDRAGQEAAAGILSLVRSLTRDDLLFVLLSGGASSLLPAPAEGITLAAMQQTTGLLLRSGASIREINGVRKHLSALQGGRLLAATPASVVALILSDVLGNDLSAIGSGPTAPDPTTFEDACTVLRRYSLWQDAPQAVRRLLAEGRRGRQAETPKPGAPLFRRVQNQIVGSNTASVAAVAAEARRAGLTPLVLSTTLTGEAREAAQLFGGIAREIVASGRPVRRPACIIAGAELTVTVRGKGVGGRAQEFALAAAREIAGLPNVWIAGFGTDGTDGPTDAAGAVVDGETLARAARAGLDPTEILLDSDSYRFFKKLGGHIMTGPTGTNVNDLYLLIVQ